MNSNYVSFDRKEVPSIVKMDRFLPSYKFVNRIGVGTTGVVYKAIQTSLDRNVAIKVIPKSIIEQNGSVDQYCKAAIKLAQLYHPCLMRIYDFGKLEDFFFIVIVVSEG